jgi:hypothetical protein
MKPGFRTFPAALTVALAGLLLSTTAARAEVKPVVDHNDNDQATPAFKFKRVPAPSKVDAATKGKFTIVAGERDENGADVEALTDGKLPTERDEPGANFFLNAGTEGGRLLLDLRTGIDVKQVNTYSWHADTRGPQVYTLYAADGKAHDFDAAKAAKEKDPEKHGWRKVATVDTRPKDGDPGGQYGVSLAEKDGTIGTYRYLLFDIQRTENDDPFGNTFYSEIDVIDANAPAGAAQAAGAGATTRAVAGEGGKYEITIDTTNAPDLTEWANQTLLPVCVKWYPIIVEMLPSDGFEAPKKFSISFREDMNNPAATGGTRIMCSTKWMRQNLKGEAVGAVVHEMVHVVQQYPGFFRRARGGGNAGAAGAAGGAAPATAPAARNPGWLVEGIPDYVRWFKYEPQTHGADIRNPARAKYDASYRVSANFLNYVTDHYDKDLVKKLNAAMRQGKYSEDLWKEYTGKTAPELAEEWKKSLEGGK